MHGSLAETAAAFDALYCNCTEADGVLCIVAKTRDQLHGCFRVGCGDHLVEAARACHAKAGLYFKYNLLDYDQLVARAAQSGGSVVGNSAEVSTVVAIGLDIDAGKKGYL